VSFDPPLGRTCSSGISAMISSMKARSRASRRASRSVYIRRIYSSVRARKRSFALADALRGTDSGELVRTRFEGLKARSSSIVTGETPWSSTEVRVNQRGDTRKEFGVPFLRLEVEGGTVVRSGVLGGVVLRISSSGNSWGMAASWTLTRIFVAMGTRRTPPLLSRTRLPGTCVHGVWRGAFGFNVVSISSSSLSEST
jgi:hypothetical protein